MQSEKGIGSLDLLNKGWSDQIRKISKRKL